MFRISALQALFFRGLRALGVVVLAALFFVGCDIIGGSDTGTAPGVEILRPTQDDAVAGTLRIFIKTTIFGSGPKSNIASVGIIVDNGEIQIGGNVFHSEGKTTTYVYDWDTEALADTTYRLEAIAFDGNNGRALSAPVNVRVENGSGVGPKVTLTNPDNNDQFDGDLVNVLLALMPGQPPLARADLMVDGTIIAISEIAPFNFLWDTGKEIPGQHLLRVKTYDPLGNTRLSDPLTIGIDEPPDPRDEDGRNLAGTIRFTSVGIEGNVFGAVAVDDANNVYFGTNQQKFYAFDGEGHKRWEKTLDGKIEAAPVIGDTGNVFVLTANGFVYGFDRDGNELWFKYHAGANTPEGMALDANQLLFFGDQNGFLHALNTNNGFTFFPPKKMGTEANTRITSAPVVSRDGTIFMTISDNVGSMVRINVLGDHAFWSPKSLRFFGVQSSGLALGSETRPTLFAVSPTGTGLYAASSDNGETIATGELGSDREYAPIVGPDSTVFVATTGGLAVFQLIGSGSSADLVLERVIEQPNVSTPAIDAEGRVHFMANKTLVALYPNRNVFWELNLGATALAPITIGPNGVLYIVTDDGKLYGINTQTEGNQLRNWPMANYNARNTNRQE